MYYHPLNPWLGAFEPPTEALDGAARLIPGTYPLAATTLNDLGAPPRRPTAAADWLLELDEFDGETVRVLIAGDEE